MHVLNLYYKEIHTHKHTTGFCSDKLKLDNLNLSVAHHRFCRHKPGCLTQINTLTSD